MSASSIFNVNFNNPSTFFKTIKKSSARAVFIGLGVTNNDCIRLFLKKNIPVIICDKKSPEQLGPLYKEFYDLGAVFSLGENYLEIIETLNTNDFIMRAPGVYFNHPSLLNARNNGIPVTSEMELFFQLCPCPIYAVTGSDGKTTTTTLISEFLKEAGFTVHLGGNIGRALLPVIESLSCEDRAVVELSSFQLMSMTQSPSVAVLTNISPNHLDVHGTMDEYIDAKKNILLHQNAFSHAVINADNKNAYLLSKLVRGSMSSFSRLSAVERGAYALDGQIYYSADKKTYPQIQKLFPTSEIKLLGTHILEDYLAAISATIHEVPVNTMLHVAQTFNGVEHRTEFIREINGVKWYNDSIASSPTRVMAGLEAFTSPVVLIAGGYDKKIPFEPMAELICHKVPTLILTGDTAYKIKEAVTSSPYYSENHPVILIADSMEDAVSLAKEHAVSGYVVTLSPACASFDRYNNFEERGRHFKAIVNAIQ